MFLFLVHWVSGSNYNVKDAIVGGTDTDGSTLYVGRTYHDGDNIPGKLRPAQKRLLITYNGTELIKTTYEFLCGKNVSWIKSSNGDVPANAVMGGESNSGTNTNYSETLYIGRTQYMGTFTPGKVHPSHGCLYISYDGKEMSFRTYETLVENGECPPSICLPSLCLSTFSIPSESSTPPSSALPSSSSPYYSSPSLSPP